MTQLPVIPSRPEKYNPTPYTFRMPVDSQTDKIKESYAKCPPFYLQLDHTLAVVWCVFSKQKINKPLGMRSLYFWDTRYVWGMKKNYSVMERWLWHSKSQESVAISPVNFREIGGTPWYSICSLTIPSLPSHYLKAVFPKIFQFVMVGNDIRY